MIPREFIFRMYLFNHGNISHPDLLCAFFFQALFQKVMETLQLLQGTPAFKNLPVVLDVVLLVTADKYLPTPLIVST